MGESLLVMGDLIIINHKTLFLTHYEPLRLLLVSWDRVYLLTWHEIGKPINLGISLSEPWKIHRFPISWNTSWLIGFPTKGYHNPQ
jgi:hypothetical protein